MLRSGDVVNIGVGLKVASEDQIKKIHGATLEVLERTGVEVYEEEALGLLCDAGAHVSGNRVKIPGWLIEEATRTAPSKITFANRKGERILYLEGNNSYFGNGSDTPYMLDPYTDDYRITKKVDVCNQALLNDALENIDFLMSMGLISDCSKTTSDLHQLEAQLLNTTKPIIFTIHSKENLVAAHKIASLIAGSEESFANAPFIALYTEPSSPLKHSKESLEKLMYCNEKGIPCVYTVGMMAGATAPITAAGVLVSANCELLSGLLISQLKKKGAPFIYGGMVTNMDMSTGEFLYGAPELYLRQAMLHEMANYYQLPHFGVGGCSDSCAFDQQAGWDNAFTLLAAALSGVNLIHDVGYLGQGLISSLESCVMCDEGIGLVKRFMRGIDVNLETLAIDVIDELGSKGHYLDTEHTIKHFKDELWVPSLMNRQKLDVWKLNGSQTYGEKAKEKVNYILKNHKPEQIDEATQRQIRSIITDLE